MAQVSGKRRARVARALYTASCHSKMMLQQKEVQVLKLEKFLATLAKEVVVLSRRVEIVQANHLSLVEALRGVEQNLAAETWLRDEELKLLTILVQRSKQCDALNDQLAEQRHQAQHLGIDVLTARQRWTTALQMKEQAQSDAFSAEDAFQNEFLESASPDHPSLDGIHFEIDRCRLFLNRMILWTLATVFIIDAAFRMLDFA